MTTGARIALPMEAIAEFCRRWQITELSLFGSVLRDDFRPDSDVDVLVTFALNAPWTLLDHVEMERELAEIIRRRIDLVSRNAVEQSKNWIRRREILGNSRALYVA
jgi:predicted nucleotidyltransferase